MPSNNNNNNRRTASTSLSSQYTSPSSSPRTPTTTTTTTVTTTTTTTSTGGGRPPPSLGWSVRCLCCCNCFSCCFGVNVPIWFHWTFFFVWILQIVIAAITQTDSWKYIVYITTLWGPVLALSVLFHEYGHVLRNRTFGGTCTYINLWPLGGFSDTKIYNGTCLQEFWTAFCGPLMHVPQMVIWVVVMAVCAPNGMDYYQQGLNISLIDDGGVGIWFAQLAKGALDLNIMIFAMNMVVPSYPLDAARMLASMAVHCGLSVLRAAYLLVIVGGLLGLGAIIWGVVSLIKKSGGLGITILIIGLFLLWTTYNLYRSITSDQIIHHPIFAPDCYRPHRREHTTSYVGGGRNTTVSSPSSALTSPSSRNKSNRPRGSKVPQTKKNDKSKKQKKVEVGSSADTSDDSFGIVDLELGENKPTAKKPAVKKKPKKKKPTPSGATATATKKKKKPSPS